MASHSLKPLSVSNDTQYGQLEIGKEYLVMGMVLFDEQLCYLIDDGIISVCPYQLFEVIDSRITSTWHFRALTKNDVMFPYIRTIWGYYEMCFVDDHYQQLVEAEEEAYRIYYRRKIEMEKELLQ